MKRAAVLVVVLLVATGCQTDGPAASAAAAERPTVHGVRLVSGDEVITCPAWLIEHARERADLKDAVCVRTTGTYDKQLRYTKGLMRQGWTFDGGLANLFAFTPGGECLLLSGYPAEGPEATGADLRAGRAFYLFGMAEPAECESVSAAGKGRVQGAILQAAE